MKEYFLTAEISDSGSRIDAWLSDELDLSRSHIQKLLKSDSITVNNRSVNASYKLKTGDYISALIPDPEPLDVIPEDIPLDILYEDKYLLVVNKPKDMVVHPAPGHYTGTLVNALLYHCKGELSGINGVERPGIVHRIDKDTTGALVVCKTDEAHDGLAKQLAVHSITRKYRAFLINNLKEDNITIDKPIGRSTTDRKKMSVNAKYSRRAVTHVELLKQLKGMSYVECSLETGRTHQIRVHCASINHPVLGDTVYGPAKQPVSGLNGQSLHAYILGFIHPITGEYMEFTAPEPEYFKRLLSLT